MSAAEAAAVAAPGEARNLPALLRALVRTEDRVVPAILRIGLGAVMFPHGAQKALGWFGGGGFSATMDHFTGPMRFPAPIAFLVIAIELVGALALIAGVLTRVAAAAIGVVMIGAIAVAHTSHGFFMNWFGNQAGEGFEYHLLALTLVAAIVVLGGGRWSVDRRLG